MLTQSFGETASGSYTPPKAPVLVPATAPPKLEGLSLWLTAGVLFGAAILVAATLDDSPPQVENYVRR